MSLRGFYLGLFPYNLNEMVRNVLDLQIIYSFLMDK